MRYCENTNASLIYRSRWTFFPRDHIGKSAEKVNIFAMCNKKG
jgi:hypothetical protein